MNKKIVKSVYRIKNWPEYNQALKRRGDVTFWFGDITENQWYSQEKTGKKGASNTYSELAIEVVLTLGAIFHLPLRQNQGFAASLLKLLGKDWATPDYTTLCRRRLTLTIQLKRWAREEPVHVVVDASGIKVYGQGEWFVKQHGPQKHRQWVKLHLAVDELSGEILAEQTTSGTTADAKVLESLLEQVKTPIWQVSADGAYDKRHCYESIVTREARAIIPPRVDARIWQHGNCKAEPLARDENLRTIRSRSRKVWKQLEMYHRRSLAEVAFSRFKRIFGDKLRSRYLASQGVDLSIRCTCLNRMLDLGMPHSYVKTA